MRTNLRFSMVSALTFCCVAPCMADGGWATQSISLQADWNMVWIEVDPVPNDPATVLSGLDYESVWSFVPGRLAGDDGAWPSYHKNHPTFLNSLGAIQGDRGYLIKMNSPGTLNITGRPVNRKLRLSGSASTLVGANFEPGNPPTFDEYFSHPDVQGKIESIYMLTGGALALVSTSSVLEENATYWVNASQDVACADPIRVKAPLEGYQFGINGYVEKVVLEVPYSTTSQMLTVQALSSATPPVGEAADAGGDAGWLEYLDISDPQNPVWTSLSASTTITVPAQETSAELEVRGVRRGRGSASEANTNSSYQGFVQITDGNGNRATLGAGMEILPFNGVWVGQAKLTNVSKQSGVGGPVDTDAPPLTTSLILALPGTEGGPLQLLDKAFVEVDRDGRLLKYRYNAILFHEPVTLSGTVGSGGTSGTLTGQLSIPANHALNPYRHRYNPEHRSGYDITRDITLAFMSSDPDPINQELGLDESDGDNELTGTYTEVISGISLEPITVNGSFKLHRLSDTTELQPPP